MKTIKTQWKTDNIRKTGDNEWCIMIMTWKPTGRCGKNREAINTEQIGWTSHVCATTMLLMLHTHTHTRRQIIGSCPTGFFTTLRSFSRHYHSASFIITGLSNVISFAMRFSFVFIVFTTVSFSGLHKTYWFKYTHFFRQYRSSHAKNILNKIEIDWIS